MSWTGAITALETHMTSAGTAAAGTANTSQWTTWAGEPAVPPRKLVTWWYDGAGDNPLIAETLTDHPFAERVVIRWYIPVSNRSKEPSRTVETELRTAARQFIANVEGDRTLGDNCEVAVIEDGSAGWLAIDDGWWRTWTQPLLLSFTDTEPIAR